MQVLLTRAQNYATSFLFVNTVLANNVNFLVALKELELMEFATFLGVAGL